jgi:glycerophosphoryl diester phosphodiesterase
MDEAPENTEMAFDSALRHAIDGIELDVQMTSDGVLVIHHDPNLQKISGDARAVSECTYDELAVMDFGHWYGENFAGVRILTFEKCLKKYLQQTQLLIEIKSFPEDQLSGRSIELANRVVELLDNEVAGAPPLPRPLILSFDAAVLEAAGSSGRWRCVLNMESPSVVDSLTDPPEYMDAYCASIHRIDPGTVDACHALGKRFMTYTCNTPGVVTKALNCGCDVIMTDRPSWLVRHFNDLTS